MAEIEKKNTKSGLSAKKKDELINIIIRKDNTELSLKKTIDELTADNSNLSEKLKESNNNISILTDNQKHHNKKYNELLIEKQNLEEKINRLNSEIGTVNKSNIDLTNRISNRNIALIVLSIALIIAIIF